jgi:hypothetical protein
MKSMLDVDSKKLTFEARGERQKSNVLSGIEEKTPTSMAKLNWKHIG